MVPMVDLIMGIVGVMIIIEVVMVVFDIGVPMTDIGVMHLGVRMGTRQELRIDMVGPLGEQRTGAPFCCACVIEENKRKNTH